MRIVRMFLLAAGLMLPGIPMAVASDGDAANVIVDFAQPAGTIRALHGVNNGPVSWGLSADLTNYHKEAKFPSARLHDCHYAGANVVDIHFIFPIFDADADDPTYYRFAETDAYLAPMVENGEQITYRLGESIECRSRAYSNGGFYVHPPKDFAKWAKICTNIIRHYNDGWADGFHYNITHWEIWNEPSENCPGMWPGTIEQYFQMYEAAATAIKALDPALKVGGPSTCNINFPIVRPFLAYCRDRKVPVDFLTWHSYAAAPEVIAQDAATARQLADEYGFTKAESHITEWHPMWYKWEGDVDANELGNPNPGKYLTVREKFDSMRGPKAAAFTATTLMLLEDRPVDMANYYTADINPWGMFDAAGNPGRVYYTFVAFNRLFQTPNRVACIPQGTLPADVTLCAGLSGDRAAASILVSHFGADARQVVLQPRNLPVMTPVEAEVFAIDAAHEMASIGKFTMATDTPALSLDLPGDSVYLVRLGTAQGK